LPLPIRATKTSTMYNTSRPNSTLTNTRTDITTATHWIDQQLRVSILKNSTLITQNSNASPSPSLAFAHANPHHIDET
jgi:hypothetical protein